MPFVVLEFPFCSHTGWPWSTCNIMAPGPHLQFITTYLTLPPQVLCLKPFKLYFLNFLFSSTLGGSPAGSEKMALQLLVAGVGWGVAGLLLGVGLSLVPTVRGSVCLLFYNWVSGAGAQPLLFISKLPGLCCSEKMAGSLRLLLRLWSRRVLVSV